MSKKRTAPQIADDDVETFIATYFPDLGHAADSATPVEKRVEHVYKFVLHYQGWVEADKSPEYVKAFARKVRDRVLWRMR